MVREAERCHFGYHELTDLEGNPSAGGEDHQRCGASSTEVLLPGRIVSLDIRRGEQKAATSNSFEVAAFAVRNSGFS